MEKIVQEKPKVKVENDILLFETKSMKLELKNKINLNGLIEFFMVIFAEMVIAKYRLDNKETTRKIRDLVSLN